MTEQNIKLVVRTTAQIGRCGEILVQYRLLKYGIESSQMTTDTGVDLVAYAAASMKAMTIQVKSNLQPKPGGGKGLMALDWWIPEDSPADLVALVDLATDQVWLYSHAEVIEHAQQRSNGRLHLYFYTDTQARPRKANRHASDFDRFKLERRVEEFFAAVSAPPAQGGAPVTLATSGNPDGVDSPSADNLR